MSDIDSRVLDAAEKFVVPLIEGDRDNAGTYAPADIVGLGLTIDEWARPEDGWNPRVTVRHFRELFPRRVPRQLTADRCARAIVAGFDDEILHVDMYGVRGIEILLRLSRCCGPTNRRRLLRFVEAWVAHAPDEAFLDTYQGFDAEWSIPVEA